MKKYLLVFSLLSVAIGCSNTQARFSALRADAFERQRHMTVRASSLSSESNANRANTINFRNAKILELDALLRAVTEQNPSLRAMQERYRQAVSQYPQAVSFDDPKTSYGIVPSSIGSPDVDFAQKIELSQKFPWPGKLRLKGEIALSSAENARENKNTLEQNLLHLTSNAYYEYYFLERALEINEVNKALLQNFKKIAETKYSAGTATKQDALQAEVEYNHLRHRRIVLAKQKKSAIGKINTLLNRPPGALLPTPPAKLRLKSLSLSLPELQNQAKRHRPELQGLAFQLRAKEAELTLAQKEFYPDFTAFGAYNSLWQEEDLQPIVGVGINIPLRLEKRNAILEQTQFAIKELEAETSALLAQISFEVKDALDALEESQHVVRLYENDLLSAARESMAAAESGYQSGANSFLTLIEAEKQVMLTELEYHKALSSYYQRLADLNRATGLDLRQELDSLKLQGVSHE